MTKNVILLDSFHIVTFNVQKLIVNIILENKSLNQIMQAANNSFPSKQLDGRGVALLFSKKITFSEASQH